MSITLVIPNDALDAEVNKCIFRGSNSVILNFAGLVSQYSTVNFVNTHAE